MKMKNKKSLKMLKNADVNFDKFASEYLFEKIQELLKNKLNKINIALSGGNTPLPILGKLKDKKIDWERINFFIVDERCVSINDELSNFGNISKIFFDKIPSKKFSMIKDGMSVAKSIHEYKNSIVENVGAENEGIPKFDLILLGMGDDGHTASLFPETEALLEEDEIVILNKVPQLKTERITFTYPTIINTDFIVVIVKGSEKEKIISELYTESSYEYPILKIVNNHPNLTWLVG